MDIKFFSQTSEGREIMNRKRHLTHTLREHSPQLGLKEAKAFEESHKTDGSGINSI